MKKIRIIRREQRENVPPDDADLGALDCSLGFVNVRYTLGMGQEKCHGRRDQANLAEVELSVLWVGNAFYLDERGVWTRITLGTLVPKDTALCVESARRVRSQRGSTSRQAVWDPLCGGPTNGAFVILGGTRANTDLVEPMYCLEEETRASLTVSWEARGQWRVDVTVSQR